MTDTLLTRIHEELGAISGRYRVVPTEREGSLEGPLMRSCALNDLADLRAALMDIFPEATASESRGHVLRLEIEREVRGE